VSVERIHEVLVDHGEHPLGQVRTAGSRGFVDEDGAVVEEPLWMAISTHRAWLVAVRGDEVRAVASADPEQVHLHRGWVVDTVQVGPWTAALRPSTRASTERLLARWRSASPHGDDLMLPVADDDPIERAPAARGAQVPEELEHSVPNDPDDRWLRADRSASEHPFDTDDGKVERARIWVLVSEAGQFLAAHSSDERTWWSRARVVVAEGRGRGARLIVDGRPIRLGASSEAVEALVTDAPDERWHDQALHRLLAGDARDCIRLVAEGLERGHESTWPLAARLLFASGDPLRSMAVAVKMLRATPDLRIRELCSTWHPAVDAQRLRRDKADVHFLRGLLRPFLGELEVVHPPADLPWPPSRPDEVFAAALAHLDRPDDAIGLWVDRGHSLEALESLASLREAAGDPQAGNAWEEAARAHRTASSERAAELLDRALELDPDPARHHLRAEWAWAAGDRDLARGHWTAAMLLDPDATIRPTLPADAERALAEHAHAEGEHDHEAYAWERAAQQDPDDERPWLEAATLYAEALDDPAHGAELLARWCAHADTLDDPPLPRWPRWCRLAELHRAAGNDEAAARALADAVRHDPLRPAVWARALQLAPTPPAPTSWWAHLHAVLTGGTGGDPLEPETHLDAAELDALHPGGTGWLERVRSQVSATEPPPRADLVRGLEKLSEVDHGPARQAIDEMCAALHIEAPDVYVFRGDGAFGCSAWSTDPPVLLLGVDHLTEGPRHLSPAGLRFLVGVELVHLAAGHPVLAFDTDLLGTSRNVYQSFGSYASTAENVVDLLTLVPGVDQIAKLQTIVSVSRRVFTTRSTIDKVGDVATPVLDRLGLLPGDSGPTSVGRQGLAGAALHFRLQADRAALRLVGDLRESIDAILRSSRDSLPLAETLRQRGVPDVLAATPPEAIRISALVQYAATLPAPAGQEDAEASPPPRSP